MAIVSRKIFRKDQEDDGPIAIRDFPMGSMRESRRLQESTNRLVEVTNQDEKLPDNFNSLSPRDQFFGRCDLFHRLFTYYKDLKRPDSEAMKQMNIGSSSFKFEELGHVPGVEVGDKFDYRAEMFVVGLHRMPEAGIACVNHGNETVACSVVISGKYEDNVDHGDVIYYSGHGGNDEQRGGKKEDQKLMAGNLGLLNSLKQKTPIRVIRGRKNGRTISEILGLYGKTSAYKKYSYNGLYIVAEHEFVDGVAGHKVHKFKLIRKRNQPALATNSLCPTS